MIRSRNFMAIASVMAPNFMSTLRSPVSVEGDVTAQTWQIVEQKLRAASWVTVPANGQLVLVSLIELEG